MWILALTSVWTVASGESDWRTVEFSTGRSPAVVCNRFKVSSHYEVNVVNSAKRTVRKTGDVRKHDKPETGNSRLTGPVVVSWPSRDGSSLYPFSALKPPTLRGTSL